MSAPPPALTVSLPHVVMVLSSDISVTTPPVGLVWEFAPPGSGSVLKPSCCPGSVTVPISVPALSKMSEIAGTMLRTSVGEAGEMSPDGSVWVADRLGVPMASGLVGVTENVPPAATVVVPIAVVPSYRVSVSPAVPVPVMIGVVMKVVSSPGPLSLAGARVSNTTNE